jgi:hypothetical protein
LVATAIPNWEVTLSLAMIDQVIVHLLPLPALRGERVGVRGSFHGDGEN